MNGLSLLDDIIFRGVFGRQKNGPALAAFLSALLHRQGPDKITQVEILNPLRETDSLDEKESVLDLPEDIRNEEGIAMAYEATNHLLADPELRYRVEARRKFALDMATNLAFAKREGLAEGLAQGHASGLAEGLREAARRMLATGMLAATVADITGLDLSEVERLASPE